MNLANKDIRDAFFDEISIRGYEDRNLVVITGDMDVFSLREFKKVKPDQFLNVGVSEQNMINVAAGLASCGKIVYIFGIAAFVTFRCYEQIKFNICSMNLPVVIVGIGGGVSFSFDGPTHHGIHDMSVMRMLPGMSVYNPCDSVSAQACSKYNGPAYVRIDKGVLPQIYNNIDDANVGYKVVRPIEKINLVSTGYMTHKAMEVADNLSLGLIDLCHIKPINNSMIEELSQSERIITIEEHCPEGGLGTVISNNFADSNVKVNHIGLPHDKQYLEYGNREWFHEKYGLTVEKLTERISKWI